MIIKAASSFIYLNFSKKRIATKRKKNNIVAEQAKKIKTFLAEKRLNYHVIYNETIREKELTQEELDKQIAKDYQD